MATRNPDKVTQQVLLPGLLLLLLTAAPAPAADIPAFPGAEGFGAGAKGGRGGKVYVVRTLEDYSGGEKKKIPGSLREACEAKGSRTIVFNVSGTIELKKTLRISEPFITIAGQTAPGGGICLRNYGLTVKTHDVVIRYLRVRPGDTMKKEVDSISIGTGSHDVIIDHCSASWSIDEALSVSGAGISNVTVQWCIISESLNDSFHKKGPHGYGSLSRTNGNISFHHNLYAHHRSRCPRPGTYGEGSILFDFRNNVIYQGGRGYTAKDPARVNYVGNYIKATGIFSATGTTEMHAAGNLIEGKESSAADPWSAVKGLKKQNRKTKPFPCAPVRTDKAAVAYRQVLYESGASKPVRDAVDDRIIEQVRSGGGRIIDSQKQVGGWPKLEVEFRTKQEKEWVSWLRRDGDSDGMRTTWERAYELNPRSAADTAEDPDEDGYTNIEECLNGTD
ncbi:MAG: pectate lyase, partial [Planctomycetota bacterium]